MRTQKSQQSLIGLCPCKSNLKRAPPQFVTLKDEQTVELFYSLRGLTRLHSTNTSFLNGTCSFGNTANEARSLPEESKVSERMDAGNDDRVEEAEENTNKATTCWAQLNRQCVDLRQAFIAINDQMDIANRSRMLESALIDTQRHPALEKL
jgi:hypothetical protein